MAKKVTGEDRESAVRPIHPLLKLCAGFPAGSSDDEYRDYVDGQFPQLVGKPCGVLGWCPYGPLVEQFPLVGDDTGDLRCLREPEDCAVYGHWCPFVFAAEPFADGSARRVNP